RNLWILLQGLADQGDGFRISSLLVADDAQHMARREAGRYQQQDPLIKSLGFVQHARLMQRDGLVEQFLQIGHGIGSYSKEAFRQMAALSGQTAATTGLYGTRRPFIILPVY